MGEETIRLVKDKYFKTFINAAIKTYFSFQD